MTTNRMHELFMNFYNHGTAQMHEVFCPDFFELENFKFRILPCFTSEKEKHFWMPFGIRITSRQLRVMSKLLDSKTTKLLQTCGT